MLAPTDNHQFNTLNYYYKQQSAYQETRVAEGATAQKSVKQGYSEAYQVTLDRDHDVKYTYASLKQSLPIQAVATESPLLSAATNILGFISNRLALEQSEGASFVELNELLEQGLAGFKQGFSEARSLLNGSGELPAVVEETLATVYGQVLEGFDALREQYLGQGLSSEREDSSNEVDSVEKTAVTAPNPMPVSIDELAKEPLKVLGGYTIGSLNQNALSSIIEDLAVGDFQVDNAQFEYGRKDHFAFELTTLDGDKVKIQANQTSLYYGTYQFGEINESLGATKDKSQFTFSVEGDLDEGELAAINELFGQIMSLAEDFYAGDIEAAYEAALNLGYDQNEIAAYSLRLHQTQQAKITAQYEEPFKPILAPGAIQAFDQLSNFTSRMVESLLDPENYRVVNYRELIERLSNQLDQQLKANANAKRGFNESVNGVINYLEKVGLSF